jgi:hypothetical protein
MGAPRGLALCQTAYLIACYTLDSARDAAKRHHMLRYQEQPTASPRPRRLPVGETTLVRGSCSLSALAAFLIAAPRSLPIPPVLTCRFPSQEALSKAALTVPSDNLSASRRFFDLVSLFARRLGSPIGQVESTRYWERNNTGQCSMTGLLPSELWAEN